MGQEAEGVTQFAQLKSHIRSRDNCPQFPL